MIYSRKNVLCGVCGKRLPDSLLFTPTERAIVDRQMEDLKRREQAARASLLAVHESGHVNLTRLVANTMWDSDFGPLVAAAHEVCPYSNATRGNVDVTLIERQGDFVSCPISNLVLGLNRAVLAEGLAFAEALGVSPAAALEVMAGSNAYSRAMDVKGRKMVERNFTVQAKLSQHLKDVHLMLDAAAAAGRVGRDQRTRRHAGADAGTDARNVFGGIVNIRGFVNKPWNAGFGSQIISFTGLDTNLVYAFIGHGNRNGGAINAATARFCISAAALPSLSGMLRYSANLSL